MEIMTVWRFFYGLFCVLMAVMSMSLLMLCFWAVGYVLFWIARRVWELYKLRGGDKE